MDDVYEVQPQDLALIKPDYKAYFIRPDNGETFDVFIFEAKPPSANSGSRDFDKIGNEMKIMLDRLVNRGVSDAVVCGLLVDGKFFRLYSN